MWWARPDSNRGPSGLSEIGYEPAALSGLQTVEENLAELRALRMPVAKFKFLMF